MDWKGVCVHMSIVDTLDFGFIGVFPSFMDIQLMRVFSLNGAQNFKFNLYVLWLVELQTLYTIATSQRLKKSGKYGS